MMDVLEKVDARQTTHSPLERYSIEVLQNLKSEMILTSDVVQRKMNSAEQGGGDWARTRIEIAFRMAEIDQALLDKGLTI